MTQYTAVKQNCLRCVFAQWCLNDAWGVTLLWALDMLRCVKCGRVWWRKRTGDTASLNARGSIGQTDWNAVRNGDWDEDESFFGRPWMDGCGVVDSIAKARAARGIETCLCCTVGLPGDKAIFTEYNDIQLEDIANGVHLSNVVGELLLGQRAGRGRKKKLLLIRADRGKARGGKK